MYWIWSKTFYWKKSKKNKKQQQLKVVNLLQDLEFLSAYVWITEQYEESATIFWFFRKKSVHLYNK